MAGEPEPGESVVAQNTDHEGDQCRDDCDDQCVEKGAGSPALLRTAQSLKCSKCMGSESTAGEPHRCLPSSSAMC